MTKIIALGFALGLAFLEAGRLKEATYHMAKLAAEAQQDDMISLGKWARMLESGGVKSHGQHKAHKNVHLLSH